MTKLFASRFKQHIESQPCEVIQFEPHRRQMAKVRADERGRKLSQWQRLLRPVKCEYELNPKEN